MKLNLEKRAVESSTGERRADGLGAGHPSNLSHEARRQDEREGDSVKRRRNRYRGRGKLPADANDGASSKQDKPATPPPPPRRSPYAKARVGCHSRNASGTKTVVVQYAAHAEDHRTRHLGPALLATLVTLWAGGLFALCSLL